MFKTGANIWEKAQCVFIVIKSAAKRPFSFGKKGPTLLEAQRYKFSNGGKSWVEVHGSHKHLSQLKGVKSHYF